MKANGHRYWTPDLPQELALERHARAMSLPARIGLLRWLPVPARLCRQPASPAPVPHLLAARPHHRRLAPAMTTSELLDGTATYSRTTIGERVCTEATP